MTGWLYDLGFNLFLAAVPVVAAVWGVRELRGAQAFRTRAVTARGVVTGEDARWETIPGGNSRARVYYPVLKFVTAQGREVETVSFVRSWSTDEIDTGMEVDVLYDPADPSRACLDSFGGAGLRRGLVILVAGVAAGVFLILLAGATALQLVTLLLLAAPAAVVLARPPVFWSATARLLLRPDLEEMGASGPFTAERLAAGALLAFALIALISVAS